MEREELLGAYADRYDTDIEGAGEALKRAKQGGDVYPMGDVIRLM